MCSHRATSTDERRSRAFAPWRLVAGLLAALGVLAIGLGAASLDVHEHVHDDADHPEHVCAITLATIGFCDTAAPMPGIEPGSCSLDLSHSHPGSFAWTTPAYWLMPAHAPPGARLVNAS